MSDPAKARCDCWDATLTEAQRWQVYDRLRAAPWQEVATWAAAEYALPAAPSRAAIYRFAARLRQCESAHRLESAIMAREEIGALAGAVPAHERLIEAYQSMAAELALKGNASDAVRLTQMAMQLAASQVAAAELEIKKRRLSQQQDALALARDKFETDAAKAAVAHVARIRDIQADNSLDADAKILAVRGALFGEVPA